MANRRIAATLTSDLAPLGTAGQRSFTLISREIGAALGPEHRAIFAEPVPSPDGHAVDWYATVPGQAEPLTGLEPERRKALLDRLGKLTGDVLEHAETLERSSDPEKQRLGAALRNATEVPDESHIYAIGEQPLVICWSHHLNVRERHHGVLSRLVPTAHGRTSAPYPGTAALAGALAPSAGAVGATAIVAAEPLPWGTLLWWLIWALIALLVGAILWEVAHACGISTWTGLNYCPVGPDPRTEALRSERMVLEDELRALERGIGLAELDCLPTRRAEAASPPEPAPAPPPAVEPEPEAAPTEPAARGEEFDQRVEENRGDSQAPIVVTLLWNDRADLDLALTCPGGDRVSYKVFARRGCGSGRLDVDANASNPLMARPVENIAFSTPPAPGRYRVTVTNFKTRGRNSVPYKLRILLDGRSSYYEGVVRGRGDTVDYQFHYPPG